MDETSYIKIGSEHCIQQRMSFLCEFSCNICKNNELRSILKAEMHLKIEIIKIKDVD